MGLLMCRCGLLSAQVFLVVNGQVAHDSDKQSEHCKMAHIAPIMVTRLLEGNKKIVRRNADMSDRCGERGVWFVLVSLSISIQYLA